MKPPQLQRGVEIFRNVPMKAFDAVKVAITKVPVLKFPDFKKPFELFTDASSIGVGAVLNQEQRPVVFASRTLSAAERNYTVTERERECLAVVWALNKFRIYLGSLPIKVITDHAALTHLTTGKNLSNRMIRWALKLAEFNIEWEHRPGTQNTIADILSRNPIESIIRDLVLSSRDQLIEEQKTDPELGHIYRYLENPEDSSVNAAIYQVRIYRHRKCDETEIGTGSSDNGSLRDESSGFDRVQRRSNDSRDGKKKGKKSRKEETITPTTSGYNLKPRKGKREERERESRLTIERKTQQGGPVRSRKGRERNDSPYIEERTRPSNKNARRGADSKSEVTDSHTEQPEPIPSSSMTNPQPSTSAMPKTAGETLSEFVLHLDDYTPTMPDPVVTYYMQSAGFSTTDIRM
ncbi:retrovirus-related Pol polyprotein from transposon gypsy [Trichonephila clavipes]|uniref:Retrovirus-related Pol polyprotein from transposon gypsy n=1 Tax=Trichonephila clavipes TaxID=2585209 RepID=A0A8X6RAG3_TRICX|nr:retrovirus-related Pol polyprotein from transposon gypsy [Trichonephila clavipes]